MESRSNGDLLPAVLTAASFFATLSTSIFAFLDAIAGSQSSPYELGLGVLCAAAFATSFR